MNDADKRALAKLYVIHAKAKAQAAKWEQEETNARRAIAQFRRKFEMGDTWPVIFSDEEQKAKKDKAP